MVFVYFNIYTEGYSQRRDFNAQINMINVYKMSVEYYVITMINGKKSKSIIETCQ